MRYQALHSLLQLLNSHPHPSLSLILYQEEKDAKLQSLPEAQTEPESFQKFKSFPPDQSLQERSFQTFPSRSPMLRCLHERFKAFSPLVQCAEELVSSRSTTDNSSLSRSGHYCTPEALEESPPGNQHFNCFLFFYSFVFLGIGQNSFPYQQEAQTFLPSSHFLE